MIQEQLQEMWGAVTAELGSSQERPAKAPKTPGGKGRGHKAKDQEETMQDQPMRQARARPTKAGLDDVVRDLIRLSLRHESSIATLRQDGGLVLYLRPFGEPTLMQVLTSATQEWRKKAEEPNHPTGRVPLRVVLLQMLLQATHEKLTPLSQPGEARKHAVEQGWAKEQQGKLLWNFQRWNPDKKQLTVDQAKDPIEHGLQLDKLQKMVQLAGTPNAIHRFCATRPLQTTPADGIAVLMLDISLRGEAAQMLHDTLLHWQGSCMLQAVGLQLRQETLQRSKLAESLRDRLGHGL